MLTHTERSADPLRLPATTYCLSPSIRIDGTAASDSVLLQDLHDRRLLRIDRRTHAAIEAFRVPRTVDDVIRASAGGASRSWWSAVCRQLAEARILVTNEPPTEPAGTVARHWRVGGWKAAADYVWATYDYPFVDYAQDCGRRIDRERMAKYVEERADDERTKRYPQGEMTRCAVTNAVLARLNRPLGDILGQTAPAANEVTGEALKTIMTVAFGRLRSRNLRQHGRAPAIRRTSPSGGSRHPTEGYLLVASIPMLRDGLHHFSTTEHTLTHIATPTASQLHAAFGAAADSVPTRRFAMVVATSMFERNMYRYREPRTFRSVHLDAGHVIATVELTAAHESIRAERLYRVDYRAADDLIGIDSYAEATMCAVLLGGGS